MSEEKREVLLEVKNLKKYFTVETNFFGKPTSILKAVDEASGFMDSKYAEIQ